MMDVTVTHDRYGRTTHRSNGGLTHSVLHWISSVWRYFEQCVQNKDTTCRQLYADRPEPIVFVSVTVNTSRHVYDDFVRVLFLHEHRESSILTGELPEEPDQFRFFKE